MEGMKLGSVLISEADAIKDSARYLLSYRGDKKLTASKCGLKHNINIKCKNMMGYDLAFSTDLQ